MQVRTGGITRTAHIADGSTSRNGLPATNVKATMHNVGVEADIAIQVVDHDGIAITAVRPTRVNNNATVCRKQGGRANCSTVVESIVYGWIVLIARNI